MTVVIVIEPSFDLLENKVLIYSSDRFTKFELQNYLVLYFFPRRKKRHIGRLPKAVIKNVDWQNI